MIFQRSRFYCDSEVPCYRLVEKLESPARYHKVSNDCRLGEKTWSVFFSPTRKVFVCEDRRDTLRINEQASHYISVRTLLHEIYLM